MYKIEKVKIGKSLIYGKKTTMDIIENIFLPLLKNLVENNCKIDINIILYKHIAYKIIKWTQFITPLMILLKCHYFIN